MTALFVVGALEVLVVVVALLVVVFPLTLAVWLGGSVASKAVSGPWILGVCSGVATRRGVPVVAVRLLALLLSMLTGVVPGIVAYLLLGLFLDHWIGLVPLAANVTLPAEAMRRRPSSAVGLDHIGRYRIDGVLGRGGMGTVYRGRDESLDRDVAVKVLHSRLAGGERAAAAVVARFAEEARSVARLASPHVVQVFEFEPQASPPYLVMEYVNGQSLQQILQGNPQLSAEAVADCGRQVLAGLAAAHAAGIVHRDVKPANILRSADGTYKLTDFGLARSLERAESLTISGTLLGTVSYLAPEVAGGDEATASSDLYSLGVTLYQMLAGTTPFGEVAPLKLLRQIAVNDPPPLSSLRDDISEDFSRWLMQLLAREPSDRFASASAALAALDAIGLEPQEEPTFPPGAAAVMEPVPRREAGLRGEKWIPRREVDTILRTAMRLESEDESLMGEQSVLEVARELDVDAASVRKTLEAYRDATHDTTARPFSRPRWPHVAHPHDARRTALLWALLGGVLALLLVVGFIVFFGSKPGKSGRGGEDREGNRVQVEMMNAGGATPLAWPSEPPPPAPPRIILLQSDSEGSSTAKP